MLIHDTSVLTSTERAELDLSATAGYDADAAVPALPSDHAGLFLVVLSYTVGL